MDSGFVLCWKVAEDKMDKEDQGMKERLMKVNKIRFWRVQAGQGGYKESECSGRRTRHLNETEEQVSWEEERERDLEGYEPAIMESRMGVQTTSC